MFSLVIYPTPIPDPDLERRLEAVSQKTDLSIYDVRQKFIGAAPTLLKRAREQALLNTLVQAAEQEGLALVCVSDDDVRQVPAALQMKSLVLENNEIVLRGKNDERFRISSGEPLFIILGALKRVASDSLNSTERAFIRGEIPESDKRLNKLAHYQSVADIYLCERDRVLRIEGASFNYSGMQGDRTDSVALNFEKLIRILHAGSAHNIIDLGFGLSTIPGCWPTDGAERGDEKTSLLFFTRYSRLMICCYKSGLYSMLKGRRASEVKTNVGARKERNGLACFTSDALPAAPAGLRTVRRGRFSTAVDLPSLIRAMRALGPSGLILPLMSLLIIGTIAAIAMPGAIWLAIALLALAMILLIHGIDLIMRKRLIENTPTSRVRSMAMGFVELAGRARQKYALKLPYLLFDCVFYRYRILQQLQSRGASSWAQVESGSSGPVPFYVEDETGRVLINPTDALIGAIESEEISGAAAHHLGNLPLLPYQKAIFEYIPEGSPIYVYGIARPMTPATDSADRVLIERLQQLKRSPQLLETYDSDQDGRIDEQEWNAARREIQKRIDAERLFRDARGNAGDGENVVIGPGRRPGLFYLRGDKEDEILKGLRYRAAVVVVSGFLVFVGAFVYLLRNL